MPGFPLRHLRSFFGSKLRDARPVENPEIEASAARLNLSEQIAAASNLLIPRAVLIAEWVTATSSFRILHQEEAWNANHEQAHPTLERSGAGYYIYTFAASYLDSDGIAIPTDLVSARLSATQNTNSGGSVYVWKTGIEMRNPLAVEFYIKDEADTLTDKRFWLEVF